MREKIMTQTNLTKTKKDLILTFLSCVLEFDDSNNLKDAEYYALFEENLYRLINLVAELMFDPCKDNDIGSTLGLFNKLSEFNKKHTKLSKKKESCGYQHYVDKKMLI